jgi:hypothetical protein
LEGKLATLLLLTGQVGLLRLEFPRRVDYYREQQC